MMMERRRTVYKGRETRVVGENTPTCPRGESAHGYSHGTDQVVYEAMMVECSGSCNRPWTIDTRSRYDSPKCRCCMRSCAEAVPVVSTWSARQLEAAAVNCLCIAWRNAVTLQEAGWWFWLFVRRVVTAASISLWLLYHGHQWMSVRSDASVGTGLTPETNSGCIWKLDHKGK